MMVLAREIGVRKRIAIQFALLELFLLGLLHCLVGAVRAAIGLQLPES